MQTCAWLRSAFKKQLRILGKAIRRMSRYLFTRTTVHILRLDRSLLMRHTRMQTCTWPRSAALASKKQLRILSKAIRRMYIWLSRKWTQGPCSYATRCKLCLTKKCGAGFHSSVSAGCHGICSADAPQGCKPALDQAFKARAQHAPQGCKLALEHWLPKSSSVSAVFVYRNQSTFLRLGRALLMHLKDANLHLTKKRGTGFLKAISRMSLYNIVFLSRNIDILKARQAPAGAPQGCKPALDQEARHWLLKRSSVS